MTNKLSQLIKEQRALERCCECKYDKANEDKNTTALLQEIQRLIDQNYNPLAPVTLITIIEESIQEALDDINPTDKKGE